MRSSLFFRFFMFFLIIICIFSTIVFLFSYNYVKDQFIINIKHELENISVLLQTHINNYSYMELSKLDGYIKETGKNINRRITIININGKVIADSEKSPGSMENHANRPEFQQALKYGIGTSKRFSETLNIEMLYIAVPYGKKDAIKGIIRTSLPAKEIALLYQDIIIKIIIINIILILLSLIAAVFFARSFTKPIKELINASYAVSEGNFNISVFPESNSEINELSIGFNNMVKKINDLFNEKLKQKELQKKILSSIEDAVMLINKNDELIMSNKKCKEIFGYKEDGFKYFKKVKNHDLLQIINNIKENKDNYEEEIIFEKEYYHIKGVYIKSTQEIIIMLYDISKIKDIDNIKKELIQNVSHELRTPLTAIKGFLETIEDDQSKENKRYVHIMQKHTQRLIRIVKDLLILSSIEEKHYENQIKEIDLIEFIKNEITIFKNIAQQKEIELIFTPSIRKAIINTDPFKLEQIIINLVENAIKYTKQGKVEIKIEKGSDNIKISIIDTGIGIPEDKMEYIFNRFYVIDRSRSRESGGTGLGLSIVKRLINLINGTIAIESELGKGSTFIVKLPLKTFIK
ncbi:HAMP domain-containing protein [candidate division WOR-3 bacterium]|nr:HAMP domain-containing protein [candidate division WOR-3 bacterium]